MRNSLILIALVVFGASGVTGAVKYGQLVRDGMMRDRIDHSTAMAISTIPVVVICSIVITIVIVVAVRTLRPE